MHDYLFSVEVVRFAFITGVVVSMLLYERRHITTGSIVVPGYIAISLLQPFVILTTFAIALFAYWFVNHFLVRWVLLYGRNKFAVLVVFSALLQVLALRLSPTGPWLWESDVPLLVGAGYVVPALIAHDMGRQGRWKTTKAVAQGGLITAVPIVLAVLLDVPGVNDLAPLVGYGVLAVDPGWVPMAVILSVLVAWGLQRNHGMRSGGFVGAAYIGVLGARPLQSLYLVAVGTVVYFFVTRALMPWMILFGRRKFATMLLLSAMTSWIGLWLGQSLFGIDVEAYMSLGSVALMPLFVPGLVANDMERSGFWRTIGGIAVGASFVVPATLVAQTLVHANTVALLPLAVAILAGSIVFSSQIMAVGQIVGRRFGIVGTRTASREDVSTPPSPRIPAPSELRTAPGPVEELAPEPERSLVA